VDALAATNDNLRKNLLLQLNRKNAVSRRTATALLERASPRSPERVKLELLLGYFFDTVSSTKLCEAPEYTFDLSVPENVTYVANGFVSHNTIAFMMDCDTTGIEPDFSLIKGKSMAGGGQLLMPNRTIPMALKKLEYSTSEIDDIIAYLAEEVDKGGGYKGPRGTVSGAPHLRPEHYPVFDCAIGERAITWRGHVDMVAACQPFLSGAASKTINLPESATVEDHEAVYIYCGKIGIKAVALYRDNCKAFQPLSDAKSKDRDPDVEKALVERRTSILGDGLLRGERRQVPRKARTNSTNFDVGMTAGYIFVREFEDGRPGAIFIDVGQAGSTLAGFIKALSVTMSLGFQYGMALDVLISKLVGMQFEPGGFTADPEIRQARSLVDYIVKWLALEYLDPSVRPELGIGEELSDDVEVVAGDVSPQVEVHAETRAPESASASASADNRTGMRIVNVGKLCETCGAIMQPTGACYTCSQCGGTSGGCG
jgi:ribonucleoside-diphosphate reductase alpha chain